MVVVGQDSGSPPDLGERLSWRRYLKIKRRNLRPRTRSKYESLFARWEKRLEKPMYDWNTFDIEEAFSSEIALVDAGDRMESSLVTYQRILRGYYNWVRDRKLELGLITRREDYINPADGFGELKGKKVEKPALTTKQLNIVLNAIREREGEILYRVTYLIFQYCLRGWELLSETRDQSKREEITFGHEMDEEGNKVRSVTFVQKGGGTKTVPLRLGFEARDKKWLKDIRDHPPCVLRIYRRKLKQAAREAGIRLTDRKGKEWSVAVHILRHSSATALGEAGAPREYIRRMGGWSENSKMPDYYTKVRPKKLHELQNTIAPEGL